MGSGLMETSKHRGSFLREESRSGLDDGIPLDTLSSTTTLSSSSSSSSPSLTSSTSSTMPHVTPPLGTGLVVIGILFVAATFSLCFHWLKLKKHVMNTSGHDTTSRITAPTSIFPHAAHHHQPQHYQYFTHYARNRAIQAPSITFDHHPQVLANLHLVSCPPIVLIAGENFPRFIAFPCPYLAPSPKHVKEKNGEEKACGDIKLEIDV